MNKPDKSKTCGMKISIDEAGSDYLINIKETALQGYDKKQASGSFSVVITGTSLGSGDEQLGKALMQGYLYGLKHATNTPKCIILVNRGVLLATEGSEALPELKALAEKGVEIVSSQASLDFYGLVGRLAVGSAADMKEIVERMHGSDYAVSL